MTLTLREWTQVVRLAGKLADIVTKYYTLTIVTKANH